MLEASIPLSKINKYIQMLTAEPFLRDQHKAAKQTFQKSYSKVVHVNAIGIKSFEQGEAYSLFVGDKHYSLAKAGQLFIKPVPTDAKLVIEEGKIKLVPLHFIRISLQSAHKIFTELFIIPSNKNYATQLRSLKSQAERFNQRLDKTPKQTSKPHAQDIQQPSEGQMHPQKVKKASSKPTTPAKPTSRIPITLSFSQAEKKILRDDLQWNTAELNVAEWLADNLYLQSHATLLGKSADKKIENIWGQVELLQGDRRVDLLVFTENLLLVIEVKGYYKNKAKEIVSPDQLQERSAWQQCYEYVIHIKRLTGQYLNIAGVVIFPNLAASDYSLLKDMATSGAKKFGIGTWDKEDMQIGVQKLIGQELKNLKARGLWDPKKNKALCAMNAVVPESFVTSSLSCSSDLALHILEREQIKLAQNLAFTGDRIVYGVAGSGKTIILLYKAYQLAKLHPDSNILILCYNKPLSVFLQQKTRNTPIEVRTFHSFIRKQIRSINDPMIKAQIQASDNIFKAQEDTLYSFIKEHPYRITNGLKYNYILIDEGQDFEKEWFEVVRAFYSPNGEKSLFAVFLDGLQAIHTRKSKGFRWVDVGIRAQGRTQYLRKNYRNRRSIGQTAYQQFQSLQNTNVAQISNTTTLNVSLTPTFTRPGGNVTHKQVSRKLLVGEVANFLKRKGSLQTAMIIWNCKLTKSGKDRAGADTFVKSLKNWNGLNLQLEDCRSKNEKMPSIKIVPIYTLSRSKGLEADLIIYIRDARVRKALRGGVKYDYFVAVTRAREEVVVIDVVYK